MKQLIATSLKRGVNEFGQLGRRNAQRELKRLRGGRGRDLFVVLAGMEAELKEFGFHGDAGDAEPAGSLGLVALGEFNGTGEDFAFGAFKDASVDVGNF